MKKAKFTAEQIEQYGFNNPEGPTEENLANFFYDRLDDLPGDEEMKNKLRSLGKEEFIKMMLGIEIIEKEDKIAFKVNYMPDYLKPKH